MYRRMYLKEEAIDPVLRSLAAAGWLSSRIVPSYSGPPRRYYRITEAGRSVLAEWRAVWRDTRSFVDQFTGPSLATVAPSEDPLP